MNLNDLWVGDQVVITHSGRIGTFIGINKVGKARIKINEKTLLIESKNIKLAPEKKKNTNLEILMKEEKLAPPKSTLIQKLEFKPEIDLHIEKLQSFKTHENPIAILEFQLRKLREFMDKAVELRLAKVTIIHGKGTGALRMETMSIIEGYPEKASIFPINNDGGAIIYLRYS